MLVDKCVHVVEEDFTYDWGNFYLQGESVLNGYWYDILMLGSCFYMLRYDKLVAYV
jgi:hypothetical protein